MTRLDELIGRALLDGEKTGFELWQAIEKSTAAKIIGGPTAVYASLRRLSDLGFMVPRKAKLPGARAEQWLYAITDAGRAAFPGS